MAEYLKQHHKNYIMEKRLKNVIVICTGTTNLKALMDATHYFTVIARSQNCR